MPYCNVNGNIQQLEDSFHQKFGLKFEEETIKLLHMEHSFHGSET